MRYATIKYNSGINFKLFRFPERRLLIFWLIQYNGNNFAIIWIGEGKIWIGNIIPEIIYKGYSKLFINSLLFLDNKKTNEKNVATNVRTNIPKIKFKKNKGKLRSKFSGLKINKIKLLIQIGIIERIELPINFEKIIIKKLQGDIKRIGNVPKILSLSISLADENKIVLQNERNPVPKTAYSKKILSEVCS